MLPASYNTEGVLALVAGVPEVGGCLVARIHSVKSPLTWFIEVYNKKSASYPHDAVHSQDRGS